MKKQKLMNSLVNSLSYNPQRLWKFAFLILLLGFSSPIFSQDVNPCGSIQVIGTSEGNNDSPPDGAVFQGIVVRNEVTPNQAVRIYNENWELLDECDSSTCGNPYTYATGTGKYYVQVQLFDENGGWTCQADPIEVVVSEGSSNCDDPNYCKRDITLVTQAEVDAFCGCEVIEGNLIIGGDNSDISSIRNLKDLTRVTGLLAIVKTDLPQLYGLHNLKTIEEDLVLDKNRSLQHLNGLDELNTIGRGLIVNNNPVLPTLDGLNHLTALGTFNISDNPELTSIQILKNITEVNGFSIFANQKLASIEGLNRLVKVGNDAPSNPSSFTLGIGGNPMLTSLAPLANLREVNGNILIDGNTILANCCGISQLLDTDPSNGQLLGAAQISNNGENCNSVEEVLAHCQGVVPSCEAITLTGTNGQITIGNLVAPIEIVKIYDKNWHQVYECNADCEAVINFPTAAGKYYIQIQMYTSNWEWICGTDNLEVTVGGGTNPCEDESICNQAQINLTTQAEVDAFCGCETVAGHLVIGNVNSLEMTDITSLHTLTNLKQVGKDLLIFRTQLTDLQGLSKLESINGSLVIDSNSELPNLAGLDNLRRIALALVLFSHPKLTTLDGIQLDKLGSFGSTNNTSLSNTSALNDFTHLNSLTILGPHPSAILSGFENLTSLGQEVMDGSALSIVDVDNLLDLNSLSNLRNVIGDITISQNGALSDCCSISHLIDNNPNNGDLEGAITLEDNREGCNSVEEILANCQSGTPISNNPCENISLSLDENRPGLIYVNGRTSQIQLLTLYDARWNKIWDGTCDKGDPLSTCNAFGVHPPGLYRVYVRMFDENWQYICETDFLEIEIPESQNSSRSGDFVDESKINLFPNPALSTLNMRTYSLKGKTGSIQIYNTFGQQIQTFPAKEFTEDYESFDVSNYENGLYLMTIKMDNRRTITKRFLVENLR